MGGGRPERAQSSPSWAQTPGLPPGTHALWSPTRHTHPGLHAHDHSPCSADTAGRTAEPFGTGEVVCCPRRCGFSPGLESKRRWERGMMPLLPPPPRSLPGMTLTPLGIWHHLSVCLLRPLPISYTQDPNKQLLRHFTKKTDSPDTDVSSIIRSTFLDWLSSRVVLPPMSEERWKSAPVQPYGLSQPGASSVTPRWQNFVSHQSPWLTENYQIMSCP